MTGCSYDKENPAYRWRVERILGRTNWMSLFVWRAIRYKNGRLDKSLVFLEWRCAVNWAFNNAAELQPNPEGDKNGK